MGETNIEWAHYTVNAWEGCKKVSPACKHCYAEHDTPVRVVEHAMGVQCGAESQDGKIRLPMWGGHDERTGEGYRVETVGWEKQLRALNRKAKRMREGHASIEGSKYPYERPRVFINSLSDTFESFEGPVYRKQNGQFEVAANSLDDVRRRLFAVIEECTELDILLLTKRPENVLGMAPRAWQKHFKFADPRVGPGGYIVDAKWPSHVFVGATVENQEMADKRIPELLRIPARVRFLSMEPLLGEVDLAKAYEVTNVGTLAYPLEVAEGGYLKINWVIVGGESGKNARPMHPDWTRKIQEQCQAAGVPFFFKQWGEWWPCERGDTRELSFATPKEVLVLDGERPSVVLRIGKKNAGRLLDGREWNEVPK
jgi:protein gp37